MQGSVGAVVQDPRCGVGVRRRGVHALTRSTLAYLWQKPQHGRGVTIVPLLLLVASATFRESEEGKIAAEDREGEDHCVFEEGKIWCRRP